MRLFVFSLLIFLCIDCGLMAQASPKAPATPPAKNTQATITPQKKPSSQPRVKPNNGPLKKNGTVNMDYKVRKEAAKNPAKPLPSDKK